MIVRIWKNLPDKTRRLVSAFAVVGGIPLITSPDDMNAALFIHSNFTTAEMYDFWDFSSTPSSAHWHRWRAYKNANLTIIFHGS